MKYSQAKQGRVFIIRLEDGDIVHETLEQLCEKEHITAGYAIILGGADRDSKLVAGPWKGRAKEIFPLERVLTDVHEVTGTGTIFPNEAGKAVLHLHMACGRKKATTTGCVRRGVKVWHVMEVVLVELLDTNALRRLDKTTGFELLEP